MKILLAILLFLPLLSSAQWQTNDTVFAARSWGTNTRVKIRIDSVKYLLRLGNVNNTSDASKPVSTAQQTAINLKMNISDSSVMLTNYARNSSVALKLNTSDSTTYQPKYRSDTARNNTYTALAGKQATGNYLTANPNIGTATGTSLTATGNITSSGGGIGYVTGNGGTVTQLTSKSTTVVLNKLSGEITMNNAALAAATIVSFTLTNSTIAATDVIILNHVTTGTRGAYTLNGQCAAGSASISVRNNTAGSLGEAIVIRFVVIKGTIN